MKSKLLFVLTVLLFLTHNLSAQSDYYSTPDVINYGVYLVKGNDKQNAKFCRVANDRQITTYYPGEVVEFGFRNGKVYKLKTIIRGDSFQKYFLEQLCTGKLNLYYLNDGTNIFYFAEDQSGKMTEITNKKNCSDANSFRTQVADISSGCDYIKPYSQVLLFNKKSMKEYFSNYNKCSEEPFRFLQYGIFAGAEIVDYKHTSGQLSYLHFRYFNFKPFASPFIGVFVDQPLYANNFSLHFETILSSLETDEEETVNGTRYSISLRSTALTFPLTVRYSFKGKNFTPFFNAGLLYAINIANTNTLKEVSLSDTRDLSNYYRFVPDNLIGITSSAGFRMKTSVRNSLFFELRYSMKYGVLLNEYLRSSGSGLSIGYNF
jgi:hypothetical protein